MYSQSFSFKFLFGSFERHFRNIRNFISLYIYFFYFFRLQHVTDVGVALVLLIAFSLVGAQGTKEIVRERLSEEKRILYLAGVHPITYWITILIWDFIVSC